MFQSILNTVFGCSHRRRTFPLTPQRKAAAPGAVRNGTYVVCLDCGREFAYNWDEMRLGEPMAHTMPAAEVQPLFR